MGAGHLFVGVHQDEGILEFLLIQDGVKLCCRGADALCITAVNHIDDCLSNREGNSVMILGVGQNIHAANTEPMKATPSLALQFESLQQLTTTHVIVGTHCRI